MSVTVCHSALVRFQSDAKYQIFKTADCEIYLSIYQSRVTINTETANCDIYQ